MINSNADDSRINPKTKTRAVKARAKVHRIVKEITGWKGVKPTIVRVTMADFLALTEMGWVNGFDVEIKPG